MNTTEKINVKVPDGVNIVNMKHDGKRSCFMREYGSFSHDDKQQRFLVGNIAEAWGAIEVFDIDQYLNGRPGACSRDLRRSMMLKFADGLWRHASFGGLSGEPMAGCDGQGFPGRTGEEGYLAYKIFWQTRNVTDAMQKLEQERITLDQLQTALAKAKDKDKR